MNSPKSKTFFSWHEGQNHRPSCHGVARRAKTDARERQQHGFLAVLAVDAGEALGEISAVQVVVDHVLHDRLEEAVLLLVFLRVGLDEVVEMRAETLPQR